MGLLTGMLLAGGLLGVMCATGLLANRLVYGPPRESQALTTQLRRRARRTVLRALARIVRRSQRRSRWEGRDEREHADPLSLVAYQVAIGNVGCLWRSHTSSRRCCATLRWVSRVHGALLRANASLPALGYGRDGTVHIQVPTVRAWAWFVEGTRMMTPADFERLVGRA